MVPDDVVSNVYTGALGWLTLGEGALTGAELELLPSGEV